MEEKKYIAHIRENDKFEQTIENHLRNVSEITGKFASKMGMEIQGKLIGLLHDIGKYSEEFQNYIKSAEGLINPDEDDFVDSKSLKGKIDHSSAGAQLLHEKLTIVNKKGDIAAQVLSLCVVSHHSGLIDCVSANGANNYNRRITKSKEISHFNEALSKLEPEVLKKLNELLSYPDLIDNLILKIQSLKDDLDSKYTLSFKSGLLIRVLLSCLLDADRVDSADFEYPAGAALRNNSEYVNWEFLIEKFNNHLNEFQKLKDKNKLNTLRQEISDNCYAFYNKPQGIYQLTVPTGGGKTLASLRFALNHAKHYKMDRIVYVIPFTSIIDQNANVAKEIFEEKNARGEFSNNVVLEHHSNLTPDEENYKQKILSENWDAPIVFTTSVQFLEAMFGYGTRSARRMHQLANSVIIFDEVQTLPVECVHMFNVSLRFLTNNCGSTVILCTATQPLLDEVKYKSRAIEIKPEQRMMPDIKKLFKELKRVEVFDNRRVGGWPVNDIKALAETELEITGSVLMIVNTKDSAKRQYAELQILKNVKLYHLSTDMCPAHRGKILSEIKACLGKKEKIVCVSTQLIEAGVDIDFGTVIRYPAGLDSIAQAAGRCNRENTRPIPGRVYIVNPAEENLGRLKDIKTGAEIAERVLDEFKENPQSFDNDIIGPEAMNRYYKYYFHDRADIMNYSVSKESRIGRHDDLFNLLAKNSLSVEEYKRQNYQKEPELAFRQAFKSASEIFKSIESHTLGVIVPYEEKGVQIINELCSKEYPQEQYGILKDAQRYSVNVFPHIFDELFIMKAVYEAKDGSGIYCLKKQHYSQYFGLSKETVNEAERLIF